MSDQKRNTQSERRAVDDLVQRQVEGSGGRMTESQARERAVRIAERSDAERRDGKKNGR